MLLQKFLYWQNPTQSVSIWFKNFSIANSEKYIRHKMGFYGNIVIFFVTKTFARKIFISQTYWDIKRYLIVSS